MQIMDILIKGNKQRTQEPTVANKTSSRSHAVLQITVSIQYTNNKGCHVDIQCNIHAI